jgi:hypothetical protein
MTARQQFLRALWRLELQNETHKVAQDAPEFLDLQLALQRAAAIAQK